MYEHRHQRLLTRAEFAVRVARHFAVGAGFIACALGIGVLGYRFIARLPWIDALLNASMILGGMGPVDPLHSDAAKFFASMYALFSGLVFIALVGLLLGPFIHRLMHRLHMKDDDEKSG
jgi:predicted membrane-bound spermidine synthase